MSMDDMLCVNCIHLSNPENTKGSDICFTITAGANLAFGDVIYPKSDGKWYKTRAQSQAETPAVAMAEETIAADAEGCAILFGIIRNDSWTWTPKLPLYLHSAYGSMTQDPTTIAGSPRLQRVGIALSATVIFFFPNIPLAIPSGTKFYLDDLCKNYIYSALPKLVSIIVEHTKVVDFLPTLACFTKPIKMDFNKITLMGDPTRPYDGVNMRYADALPRQYSQTTEPNIPTNSTAIWRDTDDNRTWLITDIAGTQYKVEMT